MPEKRQRAARGFRAFVDTWRESFAEHNLLTWSSAIAFQALIALVPLTLLLLGVLGALDESSVWKKQISPGIKDRLPKPTSLWRRFGNSFGIALVIGCCFVAPSS